jgi:ABC-type sugar transport system ATPase subunit
MNAIKFDSVTKKFPDRTVAVEQLTLGIENGETVVLIGPSGCGKTTTLRLLAGLETPTAGTVWIGQNEVTRMAPADRNVAMMFQSDALYPHMTVRGNLSFGLKAKTGILRRVLNSKSTDANKSPTEIADSVNDVAERLSIERLLDRKPHQLSGGERQRVALGRAIVRDPAAFLLDEPLSRLDARLAGELRIELKQVFRDLGKPVLYVTHDQREAMALADRMAVMDRGRIVQVGKPLEVYQRPANLLVANFVGAVPLNVLSGTVAKKIAPAGTESIGFRAEHLKLDKEKGRVSGSICGLSFRAKVREVERQGDYSLIYIDADNFGGARLIARCAPEVNLQLGDDVEASVGEEGLMCFDASGQRILSE